MSHVSGWLALGCLLAATAAGAASLAELPRIEVIPSGEVLAQYAEADLDGTLWFLYPNGARVPFVVSPDDPEISNPGDGEFHPVDPDVVLAAVAALPHRLVGDLDATIFVLPYPRAGLLSSSADDRAIYLSPGVLDYATHQVHFLVAHEMGHVFQRRYLPNDDADGWGTYKRLRGIEDESVFHDDAPHADRPREIFAEDFRALFGGGLAAGDGSVENHRLPPPDSVPGLIQWMVDLSGPSPELVSWRVFPNPAGRSGSHLSLSGPMDRSLVSLGLHDATGRQVHALELSSSTTGTWSFEVPRELTSGSYWIRMVHDTGEVTHLPLRWIR